MASCDLIVKLLKFIDEFLWIADKRVISDLLFLLTYKQVSSALGLQKVFRMYRGDKIARHPLHLYALLLCAADNFLPLQVVFNKKSRNFAVP